ncbi:putative tubulin--tyrosine ligase [Neolecta irregularis DAH-3]|uniref:Putative tubulin--tyrosine ligase n=1 Tax=Neolecta irregularis (strain DAH-3) TaxID=1198029 RepID=A0A1U7LHX9_NEOID|nr:putative tubulin--tyrosine ligase [Neolecta irregularis DAH-3]|eukprot:OLL22131.1 putative tubulin--tyrosine ligase [Neolecta irregularis DAH-3]
MADRGQGIRLFSSYHELEEIFRSFEESDSEDEGDDGIITSQLRHFVIQKYISNPLLLNNRKFHIRAYIVAFGSMKVYVYRDMLSLFASKEYRTPNESTDLDVHLTNTCRQEYPGQHVQRFWDLEFEGKGTIYERLKIVTREVFQSALSTQSVHFQTLPNAFEIFGVDYLIDDQLNVYLLEVNAVRSPPW